MQLDHPNLFVRLKVLAEPGREVVQLREVTAGGGDEQRGHAATASGARSASGGVFGDSSRG